MNYALNHNMVMGQKIPINEKKITFFGTLLVSLICFFSEHEDSAKL